MSNIITNWLRWRGLVSEVSAMSAGAHELPHEQAVGAIGASIAHVVREFVREQLLGCFFAECDRDVASAILDPETLDGAAKDLL